MRTNPSLALAFTAAGALVAAATTPMLVAASSPKFLTDDPIQVERDTEDASSIEPTEVTLFVDLGRNVLRGATPARGVRAKNLNTVDEVPNSSWFTNRVGSLPLTPDDIATGPDTGAGPAAGAWTITSSKSDGVMPGFTVKDATGERWFLKFDPPGYRAMATGTEVAVTKLMWALGYHVPENHIAFMRRDQLVVGAGATFTPPGGASHAMRTRDIDAVLAHASREGDGSYRVVASRSLPGRPVGRIRFAGTRPDDPNDLVPHEDRRELRAYGAFAAWLNHVDAKAINSLDTLIADEGRSYVRHHLIDFGSALGSGGVAPADHWAGTAYLVEPHEVARQMISFGFHSPKWHRSAFYEARSIGRLPLDNSRFNPDLWKPRVPNPAFLQARPDDKFWAARKLVAVRTDLIRAAVRTGQFGDPAAEEFLVRALVERRDAIARAYLTPINPIADPVLDKRGNLTFGNAAVDAGVARAPQGYHAVWSTFDNATHATHGIDENWSATTSMTAPATLPRQESAYVKVELSAVGSSEPSWEKPVTAYFRLLRGSWMLVGFERIQAR